MRFYSIRVCQRTDCKTSDLADSGSGRTKYYHQQKDWRKQFNSKMSELSMLVRTKKFCDQSSVSTKAVAKKRVQNKESFTSILEDCISYLEKRSEHVSMSASSSYCTGTELTPSNSTGNRSVLENLSDLVFVVCPGTLAIIYVNTAVQRLCGWYRSVVVGQLLNVMMPDAYQDIVSSFVDGLLVAERGSWDCIPVKIKTGVAGYYRNFLMRGRIVRGEELPVDGTQRKKWGRAMCFACVTAKRGTCSDRLF